MTKKKHSIREPSFTAQIEASSRPIMKMMAVRVQTALTNHINQAVYQFFHPAEQPQPSPQAQPTQGFQRVDSAFFIRNLWEAVLAPAWTKDDIIEFGKAVFAKVPLSKIDDKRFDLLLPYLTKMSETLAQRLHARIVEEHEMHPTARAEPTDPKPTPRQTGKHR